MTQTFSFVIVVFTMLCVSINSSIASIAYSVSPAFPPGTPYDPYPYFGPLHQNENNLGQVVGFAPPPFSGFERAILNDGFNVIDLSTRGGAPANVNSQAFGINDAGEIVGNQSPGEDGGIREAVLFGDGFIQHLGTLPGYPIFGNAFAIGDSSMIVGYVDNSPDGVAPIDRRAFLSDGTGMLDLNALIDPSSGWFLEIATDIDSLGRIIGIGTFHGEPNKNFLLTPTDEPLPDFVYTSFRGSNSGGDGVVPELPSLAVWSFLGLIGAWVGCRCKRKTLVG